MSDKLPPKVILIESYESPGVVTTVRNTIERYTFNMTRATPENALEQCIAESPNIIIISSKLKEATMLDVANSIGSKNSLLKVPIIFLLSQGELPPTNITNQFVEVLYHPISTWEIVNVLKTCLRKSQPTLQDKTKRYKDVSIDLSTYKVYRNGNAIHLGPTEFKILRLLMQYPREILTRESIIKHAWDGDQKILDRTVDVHVNRLRDALRDSLNNKGVKDYFIKTVRAKGYCLNLPGEIEEF